MEEIEELLTKTYEAWKEDGVQPESEKELSAFEQRHRIRLPVEYRSLLAKFGDGDLLVLQTDGGVYRLYHDGYDESPLEPIAEDLASLLAKLAEFSMDTHRAIHGK